MKLLNPASAPIQSVPALHTRDGAAVKPPLILENLPAEARWLIVNDADAVAGTWANREVRGLDHLFTSYHYR